MKTVKAKTEQRTDNVLRMYLEEINRIPLLTREEEDEAAEAASKGNVAARNKLINANLRFVVNVAKKYQGRGIPLSDLISEGNVGLINAVKKYDVGRGYHFISYAVWWIRQSILKAISEKARMIRLPTNKEGDICRIEKARKMTAYHLSGEAETREIARLLGMEEKYVKEMMTITREVVSLEKQVATSHGFSSLGNLVSDSRYDAPDHETMKKALAEDIEEMLSTLDAKEAEIIRSRYGLGQQKPLSLKELGERYDLTKERIRQIEEKALMRLRHSSRKNRLASYVA